MPGSTGDVRRATGDWGVRLALEAMATRFELVIAGPEASWLRGAGEEALAQISRLEQQLSCYRASSDISWINGRAAEGPVRVEPALFDLLGRCRSLSRATGGAFDITVGPLVRAWRAASESGSPLEPATMARARASTGSDYLILDHDNRTVSFARPGMSIDLGAAGKGYAIDCAIGVLRDAGIENALLHGGTSSVHALGTPDGSAGWQVEWKQPGGVSRVFELNDGALSVSAVHGRILEVDGRRYGHVMDPRTGVPTTSALSAVVTGTGSLECDALSTALLVRGPDWVPVLRSEFPGYDGHVA
jgi:thiamine biosynthesis lipoprotein